MRAHHQYLYQAVASQKVNQSWDQTHHHHSLSHSLNRSQDHNPRVNRLPKNTTLQEKAKTSLLNSMLQSGNRLQQQLYPLLMVVIWADCA